ASHLLRQLARLCSSFFSSLLPPPPRSTLFPYTTLFRSVLAWPALTTRRAGRCPRRVSWEAASTNIQLSSRAGRPVATATSTRSRSEEHTSELQSPYDLVCRLLLEKKKVKLESTLWRRAL